MNKNTLHRKDLEPPGIDVHGKPLHLCGETNFGWRLAALGG